MQGAVEAVWLLVVFPRVHSCLGTKGLLYLCAGFFPMFFADYIAMNAFLRNGSAAALVGYRICLGAMLLVGPAIFMVITAIHLGLQEVSPSPRILGTLNAVAETCSSVVGSVVPAVVTSLFAVGVREQVLGGHLVWAVLMVLGGGLAITLSSFPSTAGTFRG